MGRKSRDKGARVERALRDELRRIGWEDVIRVPLSGAVKTRNEYQDDVVGRPKGLTRERRFECKARAAGFDAIYAALPPSVVLLAAKVGDDLVAISLNPDTILGADFHYRDIESLTPIEQKAVKLAHKRAKDWIGTSDYLALKQDRKPFIFITKR